MYLKIVQSAINEFSGKVNSVEARTNGKDNFRSMFYEFTSAQICYLISASINKFFPSMEYEISLKRAQFLLGDFLT